MSRQSYSFFYVGTIVENRENRWQHEREGGKQNDETDTSC